MVRYTLTGLAFAGLTGLLASGAPTEQPDPEAVRSAVARSLPLLRAQGEAWIEEHGCVSCHHVPFLIWSHNAAHDRGLEVDVAALGAWTDWALEKTDRYDNKNVDGMHQLILGRSGSAAAAGDRFTSVGERLLSRQLEDGSWHAAGQLPQQRRPETETDRATTIWSLLALDSLSYSTDSVVASWRQLQDWLEAEGRETSQELVALRMVVEHELGNAGRAERRQLEVLEQQNPDGGWGWLREDASDALATGQTLYTLARVGVGSDLPAVRRAQRFLIDSQGEDGSWEVATTLRHASNPEISSYWGTGWAAIGLLGSAEPAIDATTPVSPPRDRTSGEGSTRSGTRESSLEESVSVGYVVLDARALDSSGHPMTDLTADDFRVRVDGREVRLTSAEWVAAAIPTIDEVQAAAVPGLDLSTWPRGRLIVLFFQRDLIPSRMTGLMRMRARIADFVAELPAEDLVATVVHDTRLWLHTDFTGDRELLAEVLNNSIIEHRPPPELEPSGGPSLLEAFDYEAAEQASSAEAALLVLGRALQPVPGSKAIVFMGWGLGRYDADPATVSASLRSLLDARAALFALDVTDADYHTLEGPLFNVAMETGGLYLKTNVLSGVAMRRMAGAIEGHYELSFPKPDLPTGRHRLSIDLLEARGTVYHRDSYVD